MGFFSGAVSARRPQPQAEIVGSYDTVTVRDWYTENGYRRGGSSGSLAGEWVGPTISLELSTVYACVKIIGEDTASQSGLMRQRLERGSVDAIKDVRYRLWHDAPNPDMDAGEFREALTARAALGGAGVALIENFGRATMALWPLGDNDQFWTDKDSRRRTVYIVKEGNAADKTLGPHEIFVLRGFTFNGRNGDQILNRAKQAIGLGLAAQRYAAEFLKNDPGATLFLRHPGKIGPEGVRDIIKGWRGGGRDDWPEDLRAREKGDPRVLAEGMEANRIDPDMEKQQLVETRKHQIEEIARIFRMPLHKLAHLDRMTFCLPASEEVFTELGPVSIADIQPGDKVWSFDGERIVLAAVKRSACSGEDEILEIKTTNRTIRANPSHRILIRRKYPIRNESGRQVKEWRNEYVPAGELRVGDTIVTLGRLPDHGSIELLGDRKLTVGFMEFCGLLLGDGNVLNGSVTIARSRTANYMDHYRNVIRQEFTAGGGISVHGETHGCAKLTTAQVEEVRALKPRVVTISDIARQFNANICTVTAIANGRRVYHPEHPLATISEADLGSLKTMLNERLTTQEIASQYGVSVGAIQNILAGNSWAGPTEIPERPILLREGERETCFSSASAARELKELGLGGNARSKRVPEWAFQASEELRLALLRGFLDADGTVDKLGRIAFHSVNKCMLSQIRHLCMSVGVPVTNLRRQEVRTKLPGGSDFDGETFSFTCSDPGANLKIGSHDARYIERLKNGKPFSRKERRYPDFGGRGFNAKNVGLARIVSITTQPPEKVYDLEVEGTHSFVAGGVVVHNSNVEELQIDYESAVMNPWRRRWKGAGHRHLLDETERIQGRLFFELRAESMLRGRFRDQAEGFGKLLQNGVYSINDIRGWLNLNPVDGGDSRFVQMNMREVQKVAAATVK